MEIWITAAFGTLGVLGFVAHLHDTGRWLWNPRRRMSPEIRQLHAAKDAVTEMVDWKKQRRIEERQAWATEFEKLDPPVDIDGQEIKPLTKANVEEERYRQLMDERNARRLLNGRPGYRIVNGNGDVVVDTTITGMPITFQPTPPVGWVQVPPKTTWPDQAPHPTPPRGRSGVSKSNDALIREIELEVRKIRDQNAKLKKRIKDLEEWS